MKLEERLRLIAAIVEKDIKIPFWAWIATLVVAAIGFLLLAPSALSYRSFSFRYAFTWYDGTLRSIYALYAGAISILLALSFFAFHSGEIRRGTIRSIIAYPIDMTDITIAKLVSSFIVTAFISTILFVGTFGTFFLLGVYPAADFFAIHATALLTSFLALAVGVFLSLGLAHITGRMNLSPTALGALFLLLAVLLSQTALEVIGTQFAILSAQMRGLDYPSPAEFAVVRSVAQALSVFSPHHVGARTLGFALGITRMWTDAHLVAPVALLVLAGGYIAGKKTYLDVFIK